MRHRGMAFVAGLLSMVVATTAAGCGTDPTDLSDLRILVPNQPGSGYDITARTVAKALEDAGIARGVEVFNLPGGGGSVAVQRLVYEAGNSRLAMLMGLGVVGSQHTNRSAATLQHTTAIARLISEPSIVVVTPDSPYRTIGDLITAWQSDPRHVSVGGGSLPGGPDHLAPMLIAKAIGVSPSEVNYVRYDGGGELLAAVLGQRVSFGVSGAGEYATQVRSGQLRVLAVTSERRVPHLDAPTLREAGADMVFDNWRGIVAPPDLSEQDTATLVRAVDRLRASTQWQQALARNGWTDDYLPGEQFAAFLRQESDRIGAVLTELGLT